MMATGMFALPTMQWLADSRHRFVAWVTRPPRPAGRKQTLPRSELRELAEARGIPIWEPEDINADESVERLRAYGADLLIVCDYGRILAPAVLGAARLGGINLHGSLLPKYRGAAPVQWALFHGETETGVTVIHMSPQLDAGPILLQRRTKIEPTENAEQLERRLAVLGVEAVAEAIELLADWDGATPLGSPQDDALATGAPRLKKQHGRIDFSRAAHEIVDHVRAMQPWPGAYTSWERRTGKRLKLLIERASVADGSELDQDVDGVESGQVICAESDRLWVATGAGLLAIDQLRPAGKRSQSVAEFLRGYRIERGACLGSES